MRPLSQNTRVGGGFAMVSSVLGTRSGSASILLARSWPAVPFLRASAKVSQGGVCAGPMKKPVYLSLGSNLGDRAKNLRDAIAALGSAGVRVVRVSLTYETEPVDYLDQPGF